jgi:sterol desaturase/sphingolipid hydroxylase (fatty acid hydroxylase superfamily)
MFRAYPRAYAFEMELPARLGYPAPEDTHWVSVGNQEFITETIRTRSKRACSRQGKPSFKSTSGQKYSILDSKKPAMRYQVYNPILDKYGGPILFALFVLFLLLEYYQPLRRWAQGIFRRLIINVGVSVPAFLVLRLGLIPAELGAAYWAQRNHFGVLNVRSLPDWLHGLISFLFMDYLLYAWHWLNHQVPFLWRFHNVHHTDLDLSVSTALRFHFLEMFLSGIFRAIGVLLFGAGAVAALLYEVVFEASVAFQHSNWRLPFRLERVLNWLIITPRMHGIHHSIVSTETNSNFTNLLNLWDRLHGTIRLNVPQDQIVIGVPAYRDRHDLTIFGLLLLPFRRQKDYWRFPDGSQPQREEPGSRQRLME